MSVRKDTLRPAGKSDARLSGIRGLTHTVGTLLCDLDCGAASAARDRPETQAPPVCEDAVRQGKEGEEIPLVSEEEEEKHVRKLPCREQLLVATCNARRPLASGCGL